MELVELFDGIEMNYLNHFMVSMEWLNRWMDFNKITWVIWWAWMELLILDVLYFKAVTEKVDIESFI